jgi:hypothetical protein
MKNLKNETRFWTRSNTGNKITSKCEYPHDISTKGSIGFFESLALIK